MNSRDEMSSSNRWERLMLQQILDMNERVVNMNQMISDRLVRSSRQEQSRVYLYSNVPQNHSYRNVFQHPTYYPHSGRVSDEETQAAASLLNLLMGNSFQSTAQVPPSQADIDASVTLTTFGMLSEEIRNSQTTCPITHENFTSNTEVTLINNCNHVFNQNAAIRWLRSHGSCPVCRQDIRQNPSTSNAGNNQNPDNNNMPYSNRQNQRSNVSYMGLPGLDTLFTLN